MTKRLKIGILGPGRVGAALGNLWALSGHQVAVGGSRDPGGCPMDRRDRKTASSEDVVRPRVPPLIAYCDWK
jgi:predicted dinucleotide-binding enzyme